MDFRWTFVGLCDSDVGEELTLMLMLTLSLMTDVGEESEWGCCNLAGGGGDDWSVSLTTRDAHCAVHMQWIVGTGYKVIPKPCTQYWYKITCSFSVVIHVNSDTAPTTSSRCHSSRRAHT